MLTVLIVVPLGKAGRGAGSRGFEFHRTHFSVGFQWVFSHQENAGFRVSVNLLETKGVNLHQLYATLLLNGSFPHTDKYEGRRQKATTEGQRSDDLKESPRSALSQMLEMI